MTDLDPRLHAYRPDLADVRLKGKVAAKRFVEGELRHFRGHGQAHFSDEPRIGAGRTASLSLGDEIRVFDESRDHDHLHWQWAQRVRDGYVGYILKVSHAFIDGPFEPTHIVSIPKTFGYLQGPDMKLGGLPRYMGDRVRVVDEATTRGTTYLGCSSGPEGTTEWFVQQHLRALSTLADEDDWPSWAAALHGLPYLWGGETGYGVDCSGLVSLAMRMIGRDVPRDSDMQAGGLGDPLPDLGDLRRGDLVFWRGHVGIMEDERTLLHANGHTMTVAREPLAEAIERIGYLYGQPTGARRVA